VHAEDQHLVAERHLLGGHREGYGIEPDPVRLAYYRLLWDLA
jgi:hypothetical protein